MGTDTRIKADSIDDLLCVQSLHLCISVQLIEIGYTQCKIGICKQFNCLCFRKSHKQGINIFLNSTLLQKFRKSMCCFYQSDILHISTNDDTRRIQVIVESLALTQEFRTEDDIVTVELLAYRCSIANRNRTLNNHDSFRIILNDQFDYSFNCRCIKKVLLGIIICRCSNYYKISITVCFLCIQSCS